MTLKEYTYGLKWITYVKLGFLEKERTIQSLREYHWTRKDVCEALKGVRYDNKICK